MTSNISQEPYILRPKNRLFYALKTVYFKAIFFQKKWDRIVSALDRIFSADDRIFSAQDRIYSARTVYFTFQDRIFYYLIETGISVFISI